MSNRVAVFVVTALIAALAPAAAFACSCGFAPIRVLIGDEVPENADVPLVLYDPGSYDLAVEKDDMGTWVEVGSLEELTEPVPNEPWEARLLLEKAEGERYRVIEKTTGEPNVFADFTVAPSLPETSETLSATVDVTSAVVSYYDDDAGCSIEAPSQLAEVAVNLPKTFEPYSESIIWEQRVDGVAYRLVPSLCSATDYGPERDLATFRLAAPCGPNEFGELPDSDYSLTDTDHVVTYIGYIPGTQVTFTVEMTEVDLSCDPPEGDSGNGAGQPKDDVDEGGCSSTGRAVPSSLLALLAILGLIRLRRD